MHKIRISVSTLLPKFQKALYNYRKLYYNDSNELYGQILPKS